MIKFGDNSAPRALLEHEVVGINVHVEVVQVVAHGATVPAYVVVCLELHGDPEEELPAEARH